MLYNIFVIFFEDFYVLTGFCGGFGCLFGFAGCNFGGFWVLVRFHSVGVVGADERTRYFSFIFSVLCLFRV